MRTRWLLIAVGLLTAVLAVGALACGDDDDDGNGNGNGDEPMEGSVEVTLTEWQVILGADSAPAGSVTFNTSNIGQRDHELVVVRTDLGPTDLAANEDGSVDEAGEGIEIIDEIEEFAPEGEESLTLDLEAGSYVLICNVVEETDGEVESHYALGMATAFEVTS